MSQREDSLPLGFSGIWLTAKGLARDRDVPTLHTTDATLHTVGFGELIAPLQDRLDALLAIEPVRIESLPSSIPNAGIYLLSEGGVHAYVGRTNRLRKRLRNHISKQHTVASFAFLLARIATGESKASYQKRGSRDDLMTRPPFRDAFFAAVERIRIMEVRYVEEVDPVRQALLEIFVAVELSTKYNDFDTH